DLKFQLVHGQNPWNVWRAIRDLLGIGPLDALVEAEWKSGTRRPESWEWKSFAAVAAHYGHLDALGALAHHADSTDWWQAFQKLTGCECSMQEAGAWWDRHKDELVFDKT